MTHEELILFLQTRGNMTDAEATLLDRLIMAMDEVEALSKQVRDQSDLLLSC
jgi:hypothetical protein